MLNQWKITVDSKIYRFFFTNFNRKFSSENTFLQMKNHSKFGKKNSLTILTCLTACLGFIMLCVSVSTDNWLTTFERDSQGNGTIVIAIHSGLWRECKHFQFFPSVSKKTLWNPKMKTFPRHHPSNCTYIKYFKSKPKNLAEIKPPDAILYDMQPAAFFPTTGLLGLFSGCILSFLSYCDQKVKKLIFVGGGLFVLSGIFLLVGIVLYVGSISQAFDSNAGNSDAENKYEYEYGESFYFSVFSFVLTEFSGIFAIYLYIAKHRHYLRIKREKLIARSQSVNSCVGLVPSASRFSFEAPPERLINSTDLSALRKKRDRNISASTSVDWCEVSSQSNQTSQSQWLLSNSHSKGTMITEINPSQSGERLFRMTPNGPNRPVFISKNEPHIVNITPAPVSLFYEEEIGETSFGYHPRLDFSATDQRIFYDNNIKAYYVDTQHLFNGKQNIMISPEHSIISTVLSPRHNKCHSINQQQIVQSSLSHLKDIHLLTSIDSEDVLSNGRNESQCNCAQIELNDHINLSVNSVVANNAASNIALPQKTLSSSLSSRKITSV